MPLIKEVFFNNQKKIISILDKQEMLNKANVWVSETAKKDYLEKQKSILKSLNWFQKITFAGKEFFVEKSNNPLKLKQKFIDKDESRDTAGIKFIFSLFPVCITPAYIYGILKNWRYKNKVAKGEPVYLKNLDEQIGFYGFLFLFSNAIAIGGLLTVGSLYIYLSIVISNLLLAFINFKTPYLDIENYELMNFTLEENEVENMDGVEAKILNMEGQEIHVKNKKIEYDFIKDMDFSDKEQIINTPEENAVSFKKHL